MGSVKVHLRGKEGALRLRVEENGWCRCYLQNVKSVFLGADLAERLVPRLLHGLQHGGDGEVRRVAGYQAQYLLGTMEMHHTWHLFTENGHRVLIWTGPHNEWRGLLKVPDEQVPLWLRRLRQLLAKYS